MKFYFKVCYFISIGAICVTLACTQDEEVTPTVETLNLSALNWERSGENPVVTGEGTSIEDLADPAIIYDNGVFKMWAGSVKADKTIAYVCYSESVDAVSWSQLEIVFQPQFGTNAWDNQKVEVPAVIKDEQETDPNKRYKMWYGGANTATPDNTLIGYAFSPDGKVWTRLSDVNSPYGEAGLVMKPGFEIGDAGVVSDPTVVKKDQVYHIWYNSFGANNEILISYATSMDGYNWDKYANNPVMKPTESWEEGGPGDITKDVSHPFVGIHPDTEEFYMIYGSFNASPYETYDGLGYASSKDGIGWVKDITNPFFVSNVNLSAEQLGIHAISVVFAEGIFYLFYGAAAQSGRRNILYASAPFNQN